MKLQIIKILICFGIMYLSYFSNAFSQSGWVSQTIGTRSNVDVKFLNDNSGFIIGSDGVILKTTNQGLTWIINSSSIFQGSVSNGFTINANSFSVLAGGVGYKMVYTSTNSGANWISGTNNITPVGIGSGYIYLRGLTFLNSVTGYVCGSDYGTINGVFYVDGIIYKTTNSGVNWFQSGRIGVDYYDIKFKDEMTGYAVWGEVIKTTNEGGQWGYIGGVFSTTFSISIPSSDTLFMSGERGEIYRSINQGVNWVTFQTPVNDTLKNMYFIDAKTGYAVGDSGAIVRTTNAGENWTFQNSGTTKNLKSVWFINKDTGFVVGDSGIILKTVTAGILVDVNNSNEFIPDKFSLHQNYPNPFNPSTTIKYELPFDGNVAIKIYDITGRMIMTLVNENKTAGKYEVIFNGDNFASGIYYYKIESGNFSQVRKMILIK